MHDIWLKIINGELRDTINAHGPITKEFVGSASKRIVASLRVCIRNSSSTDDLVTILSLKEEIEIQKRKIETLEDQGRNMKRSLSYLGAHLQAIRDGKVENPIQYAKMAICNSRKIRKGVQCEENSTC